MKNLPSIKKLQYLIKLYEIKHFGRTADACFVSQSTLSAGIKDLENQLGQVLIERDRQTMVFTKTGIEIVQQAKQIISATKQLVTTAEKSDQFFESTLRIGVIPTIAPFLIPEFLKELSIHYPKLKILIREDLTDPLIDLLKNGELELLILALPYPSENIHCLELFTDSLKLVYAENSKFKGSINKTTLKSLPNNSVLLLEDGHCLKDHTLNTCHLFDKHQINQFSTNSLSSVIEMIRYDMGVSFIPEIAIKCGILRDSNLKVYQEHLSEEPFRGIGLAWRDTSPFSEEFKVLGEHLIKIHA